MIDPRSSLMYVHILSRIPYILPKHTSKGVYRSSKGVYRREAGLTSGRYIDTAATPYWPHYPLSAIAGSVEASMHDPGRSRFRRESGDVFSHHQSTVHVKVQTSCP